MTKICVHTISMGDVDDPEIYIAQPIWEWQQTEAGKWVMENAVAEPVWLRSMDMHYYGYKFNIVADLKEEDASYFLLKYGNNK